MTIIGINYAKKDNGETTFTIHVMDEFPSYYNNNEAGRGCIGKKVDTIYVGSYNCSNLKPGMEIDISYDKAITTAKGTYQPIKRIDILSSK